MRFTCDSRDFLRLVQEASAHAGAEMYQGILIRCDRGTVSVSAHDSWRGYVGEIAAENTKDGDKRLGAKVLLNCAKRCRGELTVRLQGKRLRLESTGGSTFTVPHLDEGGVTPELPTTVEDHVQVGAEDLMWAMAAVSTVDPFPQMEGAEVQVASDGHLWFTMMSQMHLARRRVPYMGDVPASPDSQLSPALVKKLKSMPGSEPVELGWATSWWRVRQGLNTWWYRAMQCPLPDYQTLLTDDWSDSCTVISAELSAAVRDCLACSPQFGTVSIAHQLEDREVLDLNAGTDAQGAHATAEFKGQGLTIKLGGNHLLKALGVMDDETEMRKYGHLLQLRGAGRDDDFHFISARHV